MTKYWNMPYKTEPWESPQYQNYLRMALDYASKNNLSARDMMINAAVNLSKKLIKTYNEKQAKVQRFYDAYQVESLNDGKIPTETASYYDISLSKDAPFASPATTFAAPVAAPADADDADDAIAPISPVLIAVAGVLLYIFVIK